MSDSASSTPPHSTPSSSSESSASRGILSRRPTLALVVGSLVSIILDQWSKAWAVKTILIEPKSHIDTVIAPWSQLGSLFGSAGENLARVPVDPQYLRPDAFSVTSWFRFTIVGNKGAAWGIFKDLPETMRVPFFVVLSAVALIVLLTLYYKSAGQKLTQSALILIAGGAIGNLIDRIQIGYVIDFIDWHYGNAHWPTFNVADISISVGVGLIMIDTIRQTIQEVKAARAQAASSDEVTEGGDEG